MVSCSTGAPSLRKINLETHAIANVSIKDCPYASHFCHSDEGETLFVAHHKMVMAYAWADSSVTWTNEFENMVSSIAYSDRNVYVAVCYTGLFALDAATGDEIRTFSKPVNIFNVVALFIVNG
jgi:hypothetical protein